MYKDLSLKEKSELFKLMVNNGITDINEIEKIYNSYQDGGNKISADNLPESQQYAVTTPDGQRKVFNSKQEASDYITANTPKGYSLYDITNYGTNIDKGQTAILNRNTEREIEKATKQEELAKARLATIQQNKEASKEMLSYMPVIGDGMDLYQLGKDIYNKQYGNAAISLAALTAPNWAGSLLKPIGKGIKKGYSKIKNILNTNNNFIDYTLNKHFKTNDIDPLEPQDEFAQYKIFGNDDPDEFIKEYEHAKKYYFDILDQNSYEWEIARRLGGEDNVPRINKHRKPFKELGLGEQYKLLPEVETAYYREHFNDDEYVKNYDKIMDYIDASYIDENTLLKSSSDIDEKNIGLIGDHLWDDLYYKAITDNNLEEVQKLKDLHFKQKAVNNKSNRLQYHGIARGYDPNFTIFNPKENHASIFTSDDLNTSTSYVTDFVTLDEVEKGMEMFKNKMEDDLNDYLLYAKQNPNSKFSNTKDIKQAEEDLKKLSQMSKDELRELTLKANPYSPNRIKKLYTYLKNPIIFDNKGNQWSDIDINNLPENIQNLIHRNNENINKTLNTEDIENISRKYGYDGVIVNNVLDFGSGFYKIIDRNKPSQIVITNDPRKIKLADPITYDDNGKIIPLSKRDDFTNRDMRYSWLLPTIGVGTGLSLMNNENNQYKYGGSTNKFDEGGNKQTTTLEKPSFFEGDTWKPWFWGTPEYNTPTLKDAIFNAYDDGLLDQDIMWNNKAYKARLTPQEATEWRNSRNISFGNKKTKPNSVSNPRERMLNTYTPILHDNNIYYYDTYSRNFYKDNKGTDVIEDPNNDLLYAYYNQYVSPLGKSNNYEDMVKFYIQQMRNTQAQRRKFIIDQDLSKDFMKDAVTITTGKSGTSRLGYSKELIRNIYENLPEYNPNDVLPMDIYTALAIPYVESDFGHRVNSHSDWMGTRGNLIPIFNNDGYELPDDTFYGDLSYGIHTYFNKHAKYNKKTDRRELEGLSRVEFLNKYLTHREDDLFDIELLYNKDMLNHVGESLKKNMGYNKFKKNVLKDKENPNFYKVAFDKARIGKYNPGKEEVYNNEVLKTAAALRKDPELNKTLREMGIIK